MTCSNILRDAGKPYPRTCEDCGLGPCKNVAFQTQRSMTIAELIDTLPDDAANKVCHGLMIFVLEPDGCVRLRSTFPEAIAHRIIKAAADDPDSFGVDKGRTIN